MSNGYRDGGGSSSHVGISLPQQGKPTFSPVQPFMQAPSIATGPAGVGNAGGLPFLSFDLSSAQTSGYGFAPPPSSAYYGQSTGFFEEEAPLLEELGINTSLITQKLLSILNPIRLNARIHEEGDLSGPFVVFMLFGVFQLLAGKVQFGIILGWLAVASFFIYFVFNNLTGSDQSMDVYRSLSYVGYSLIPMVIFSALSLFLPRNGITTIVITCLTVVWCTRACTTLLLYAAPHAEERKGLVAYACGLVYAAFSLLVVY